MAEVLIKKRTTLEDWSLWAKYKLQVWHQDSPQSVAIHNSMRLLRCIGAKVPYASMPITSGKYLSDLLIEFESENKRKPVQDEMKALVSKAIAHNEVAGQDFVKELFDHVVPEGYPIINPVIFNPVGLKYEQAHFQALWLNVIGEMCDKVYVTDGFGWTNGGAEEFTHAQQLRLGFPYGGEVRLDKKDFLFYNTGEKVIDHTKRFVDMRVRDKHDQVISIDDGYIMIEKAVDELKARGQSTSRLEYCLAALEWTGDRMAEQFFQPLSKHLDKTEVPESVFHTYLVARRPEISNYPNRYIAKLEQAESSQNT